MQLKEVSGTYGDYLTRKVSKVFPDLAKEKLSGVSLYWGIWILYINHQMGLIDKIKEIESEIARTQKNKATEYHMGQLKAKLAKYRTQLLEPSGKGPKG